MKYCSKCGKELFDEAVMCPECGHNLDSQPEQVPAPKKPAGKKKIVSIIVSVVVLIGLLVGGFFGWRYFKIEQVKKDLMENEFAYEERTTYTYTEKRFSFDATGACTYQFYMYGLFDTDYTYPRQYEIEIKNGKVFLNFDSITLEVEYNDYGEIKQLCDIVTDEVYKAK